MVDKIEIICTSTENGSVITFGTQEIIEQNITSFNHGRSLNRLWAEVTFSIDKATKFFAKWLKWNPLGLAADVIIKYNDVVKFTGTIEEMNPLFANNKRQLEIICRDKTYRLVYANMNERKNRRVRFDELFLDQVNPTPPNDILFGSRDFSGTGTSPWGFDYDVIPLWLSGSGGAEFRIPFSEYQTAYNIGAVAFNRSRIKVVGDSVSGTVNSFIPDYTDGTGIALADASGLIFGKIPWYDPDDTSMRITQIMTRAFEFSGSGGLAWVDGTDFTIENRENDILSRVDFVSDEGTGYISDWINNIYENPAIGFPPSYQIHDYSGSGVVEAKLLTQNSGVIGSKDIYEIFGADFPSSITEVYSRAVGINNQPMRKDITDDIVNIEILGIGSQYIQFGNKNLTINESSKDAFGFIRHEKMPLNQVFPKDRRIIRYEFDKKRPIDTIQINTTFLYAGDEPDFDVTPPVLGGMTETFKKIHRPMVITVEWSDDGSNWFPIHPQLFYATVDILGGKSSWLTVQGINQEAKYLSYVVNEPAYVKVGKANLGAADRAAIYFLNEIKILERGRVLEFSGTGQPQVSFTDNPSDPNRFLLDITNTTVDMFRPKILGKLENAGNKFKTMQVEMDDVFDFSGSGSTGSKLLVSQLDDNSRQNVFDVQIGVRTDLNLGDTIYSSRFNVTDFYLLTDIDINAVGQDVRMNITCQNVELTNE